jgi:hypothetical protein
MAVFKSDDEIRRMGAAARRQRHQDQRLAEKYRQDLWSKPSSVAGAKGAKPRSAGEALFNNPRNKLLKDSERQGVSPLDGRAGSFWGRDMSKADVVRSRKR